MIHLLLVLVIFGFIAYLITLIPMAAPFKQIIIGVVCIVAVIYVLQALGVNTGFGRIGIER